MQKDIERRSSKGIREEETWRASVPKVSGIVTAARDARSTARNGASNESQRSRRARHLDEDIPVFCALVCVLVLFAAKSNPQIRSVFLF